MNKLVILKFATALTASLFAVSTVSSQVIIAAGDTYTQNFDLSDPSADLTTVTTTGTAAPAAWSWTNNSTYAGWFRQVRINSSTPNALDKDFIGEFQANTVRFGSMGNGGTSGTNVANPFADRALGALSNAAGNEVAFGLVMQVSGAAVTGLNVSYTGEQWFRSGAGVLNFQYKVMNSFTAGSFLINDETGWTDVDTLDFTALVTGSNSKLNGNNPVNQSALSDSIALSASDGEYIAIRWRLVGTGTSAALGVDNLSITAVPEPATYALLAGLLTLGFALYRRRRA
jgi:hypothetical protein